MAVREAEDSHTSFPGAERGTYDSWKSRHLEQGQGGCDWGGP